MQLQPEVWSGRSLPVCVIDWTVREHNYPLVSICGLSFCLRNDSMCIRCELRLECCRHTAINSLRARFTKDWKAACGVKPGKETFNSILFSCIAQADAAGRHNWCVSMAGALRTRRQCREKQEHESSILAGLGSWQVTMIFFRT